MGFNSAFKGLKKFSVNLDKMALVLIDRFAVGSETLRSRCT